MTFIERLESLNPEKILVEIQTDISTAKTDLAIAQKELTTLADGYLTVTTELDLVKQALRAAGIDIAITVDPSHTSKHSEHDKQ